jgi:hypothetical protein
MSRKPNTYNQIVQVLQQLHTAYPTYNIGRHISTALSDYGDLWGVTDKEFLFALEKYKAELEMDVPRIEELEIDEIVKDGMNLGAILKEEEEDEYGD